MTALLASLSLIALLLAFSAFFSASETAITAASRARAHQRAREGLRRAKTLRQLIERRAELIGAILLGNNLVNILASAIATSLFLKQFGEVGILYATLAMTILIVVLAELLPKTWTIRRPDEMALSIAPFLRILFAALSPAALAARKITQILLPRPKADPEGGGRRMREEIRGALDLHLREGAGVKRERDMIGGILDLDRIEVGDVMVHRKDAAMIEAGKPVRQTVEAILASGHTRLPLWEGDEENIIGLLHARDLLRAIHRAEGRAPALDLKALARPPWFVPETRSLRGQLSAFLARKTHCALVVDEYGSFMGLITLEDILEEIVGEIADEYDLDTIHLRREPDGSVLADGAATLRDINRILEWNLPQRRAPTVAGLVIDAAARIPDRGEAFDLHGVRFEIMEREGQRITLIKMTKLG